MNKKFILKECEENNGPELYKWCGELYPITRSITGEGIRESIKILFNKLSKPGKIESVVSGSRAFDWTVPDEWNIREAWIEDENGERVVDFKNHNLHVVGYSEPIDKILSLEALQYHLHSLEDQPNAIPYITSYYKRTWGFCITHTQRQQLKDGLYKIKIDSDLKPGILNYGEIIIPGSSRKEVFLSTYVCHPSMANNELSGPVVTTALAKWLQSRKNNIYTYRIVYIPETIGSIVYLSKNLKKLKKNVIAGFNVTCIGDNLAYSYLPTRTGDTLSDKVAKHVLKIIDSDFKRYSWLDRGSDERQYCSPNVDLPIASIMRTAYGKYPEYHTSLDDMSFICSDGLMGGYCALKMAIEAIEINCVPITTSIGEPQLGKRGLYSQLSKKGSGESVKNIMNLLTYSDGKRDLIDIAELLDVSIFDIKEELNKLISEKLITLLKV